MADGKVKVLRSHALFQRQIAAAEQIHAQVERNLGVVKRLQHVLGSHVVIRHPQIVHRLFVLFGDFARHRLHVALRRDAECLHDQHAVLGRDRASAFGNQLRMRDLGLVADRLHVDTQRRWRTPASCNSCSNRCRSAIRHSRRRVHRQRPGTEVRHRVDRGRRKSAPLRESLTSAGGCCRSGCRRENAAAENNRPCRDRSSDPVASTFRQPSNRTCCDSRRWLASDHSRGWPV